MPTSLYNPDDAYLKQLAASDPGIVYNSILEELAAWEQRSCRDCDEIPRLADTLIHIDRHDMQPIIENWLAQNPSPERYEVAGWFLWSYWMGVNQLNTRLVQRFIAASDDLIKNVDALHAVLFALTAAAKHRTAKLYPAIRSKLVDFRNNAVKYKLEEGILGHLEDV